jgi:hypothetical protein
MARNRPADGGFIRPERRSRDLPVVDVRGSRRLSDDGGRGARALSPGCPANGELRREKFAKTVTRVLFFRSQKNQASLRYVAADATINASVLATLRETIAARLAHYTGYVRGFDV